MHFIRTSWLQRIAASARRAGLALGFALALAGCGGNGSAERAAPARIEIAPSAVLLTERGATKALVARVFDAAGNPVDADVEWSSSRPAEVRVNAAGVVRAVGAGGASQVTARVGSLASPPLLVVHTPVPAGTVLLTDANITGDLVETDPDAPPAVGNTYVVRLVGVAAPRVGDLLMNTESQPVAGRVTAVESAAGEHRVTLALVPAPEMFPNLVLDEAIDLNQAEVEVPAALHDQYDIQRDGNTFTFTPKAGAFARAAAASVERKAAAGAAREQPMATGTAALPPFTSCEITLLGAGGAAGLPVGLSLPPTFTFTLNNRLDIKYASATGLERFIIHGEPSFAITGGLRATVAFEGKVTCETDLLIVRIPVGGPLSLIIGGLVPVGVGLELGGKITAASMGLTTSVTAKTVVDVGVVCPVGGECDLVKAFGPLDLRLIPTIDVPSIGDLRLEPSLSAYGYVKASIGNPFLRSLKFDALSVKAGAALRGSFAPMSSQIADPLYRSDYRVLTELRAGAGTQLSGLAAMLGLRAISAVELLVNTTLASSPLGTVAADKAAFVRGDSVNFTVALNPAHIEFPPVLGPYNVRDIVLVRRIDITTQQEVARVTASSGQTQFSLPFVADGSGRADEFFAFVVTTLAPVDLLALELGQARAAATGAQVTGRSIDVQAARFIEAVPDDDVEQQRLIDVVLGSGSGPSVQVSGTYEGVPQSMRAVTTEDSMTASGGAVALTLDCSGLKVFGAGVAQVLFDLEREQTVTVSGALRAPELFFSNDSGVIALSAVDPTGQSTTLFLRPISATVRDVRVDESLRLPAGRYGLVLSMTLEQCNTGNPDAPTPPASMEGRISLGFAP